MREFVITGYGEAEEVFQEQVSRETTPLKPNQVRVKIKAFAINPYDVALRSGSLQAERELQFPFTLGSDAAGIVLEVGNAVVDFQVGEGVVVHVGHGAYADELIVAQTRVAQKLPTITFSQAAALVTPGLTALNFVEEFLPLLEPATILIQGASGAVGSLLTQLYVKQGHRVVGTASRRNQAFVESLGVAEFIAYDEESVADRCLNAVDVVIDATKGSRSFTSGILCLKAGGTYVALNDLPAPNRRAKAAKYLQFTTKKRYTDAEALTRLLRTVKEEQLVLAIASIRQPTVENVIAAHLALEGHPPAGKFIIEE
jgi:NADPH:quinone reductase-like Zn-dependent oxidoreductase